MTKGDSLKSYSSSYSPSLHEKPIFHYIIVILILATLIVSVFGLVYAYQVKKAVVPKAIHINDFLKKLTSHDEMKSYVGIAPLNIIQVNSNNFANLQAQISGLDMSYIGNFIVQYKDKVVVYDYDNNKIKGVVNLEQQQPQLPGDFFTKLNSHSEMQGLQSQQPVGGQLDAASLSTLKQQFPDVYANANVGDFLLRYETRLIIYDYNNDRIVNVVNLG